MAFGTGSAIAHRAVGAVMGSMGGAAAPAAAAAAPAAAAPAPSDCSSFQREFSQCLAQNKSDIGACQHIMQNLEQCQTDARLR
jgi:hypothetical protein